VFGTSENRGFCGKIDPTVGIAWSDAFLLMNTHVWSVYLFEACTYVLQNVS
jgi:hypothetical protein